MPFEKTTEKTIFWGIQVVVWRLIYSLWNFNANRINNWDKTSSFRWKIVAPKKLAKFLSCLLSNSKAQNMSKESLEPYVTLNDSKHSKFRVSMVVSFYLGTTSEIWKQYTDGNLISIIFVHFIFCKSALFVASWLVAVIAMAKCNCLGFQVCLLQWDVWLKPSMLFGSQTLSFK